MSRDIDIRRLVLKMNSKGIKKFPNAVIIPKKEYTKIKTGWWCVFLFPPSYSSKSIGFSHHNTSACNCHHGKINYHLRWMMNAAIVVSLLLSDYLSINYHLYHLVMTKFCFKDLHKHVITVCLSAYLTVYRGWDGQEDNIKLSATLTETAVPQEDSLGLSALRQTQETKLQPWTPSHVNRNTPQVKIWFYQLFTIQHHTKSFLKLMCMLKIGLWFALLFSRAQKIQVEADHQPLHRCARSALHWEDC